MNKISEIENPQLANHEVFKQYEEVKEKYQKWYFEIHKENKAKAPTEHQLILFIQDILQEERKKIIDKIPETMDGDSTYMDEVRRIVTEVK